MVTDIAIHEVKGISVSDERKLTTSDGTDFYIRTIVVHHEGGSTKITAYAYNTDNLAVSNG